MLHENVREIRISEKLGVKYMQRWEELEYARQDGKNEGEILKLIQLICKKMRKQKPISEIAEDLEEEIQIIQPIYEIAQNFAPDYDYERVYKEYCAHYIPQEE